MIIYDLICDNNHKFEGWFHSADNFEAQVAQLMITCPQCDSCVVRRIPSAVAISSHAAESKPQTTGVSTGATTLMPAGTQASALYSQLIRTLINDSEDVGNAFVKEARKIHYNEAPERSIRGYATAEECDELRDEGIEILHLPVIKEDEVN